LKSNVKFSALLPRAGKNLKKSNLVSQVLCVIEIGLLKLSMCRRFC